MFEKRFAQMRVFRRKIFILIYRVIKHLNRTMNFELLSKIKTCTCFLTKVTLIFKELLEKILRTSDNVTTFFKSNCMAYFLDWIKYEINGCEIDETRFVGMTSILKYDISLDNLQSQNLLNSGWSIGDEISTGPLQLFCNIKKFVEIR